MFAQHQRGRKARQKIRLRVYENSGTAFLEIKDKDNRGRTDKKRIPAGGAGEDIMPYSDFIRAHSRYMPESLAPQVRNRFWRITLVNRLLTERLTIDTGLCFHNLSTGCGCSLEGLVIIELKRNRNTRSPARGDAARAAYPSGRIQQVLRGHGPHRPAAPAEPAEAEAADGGTPAVPGTAVRAGLAAFHYSINNKR